ncbi:MAG: choline-sulfatase, partial [Planctomycetota bacterium]
PAITTHGRGNHSVKTESHRYIRYQDGSEELYDVKADPYEWKNLADEPSSTTLKTKLAKWLPTEETPAPKKAK